MERTLPSGNYGTVDVLFGDILVKTAAECLREAISEMADASEVPDLRRLMNRMAPFLRELTVRQHALHQVEGYLQTRGDVVGQRAIDLVELLALPSKPPFAVWTWTPIFIGLHAYANGDRGSSLAFSLPWPEEFEHSFELSVTMSVSGIAYREGRRKGLQPTARVPVSLPWYVTPTSKKVALAPQIKPHALVEAKNRLEKLDTKAILDLIKRVDLCETAVQIELDIDKVSFLIQIIYTLRFHQYLLRKKIQLEVH